MFQPMSCKCHYMACCYRMWNQAVYFLICHTFRTRCNIPHTCSTKAGQLIHKNLYTRKVVFFWHYAILRIHLKIKTFITIFGVSKFQGGETTLPSTVCIPVTWQFQIVEGNEDTAQGKLITRLCPSCKSKVNDILSSINTGNPGPPSPELT